MEAVDLLDLSDWVFNLIEKWTFQLKGWTFQPFCSFRKGGLVWLGFPHDCLYLRLSGISAWLLSYVWLFATLWTIAQQAALSLRFSRQEYWSRLPFPPPRESSLPRGPTWVSCFSCTGRWILYHWTTKWNYPVTNVASRIHVPFILQIFIKSLLCTGACKTMKKNQT